MNESLLFSRGCFLAYWEKHDKMSKSLVHGVDFSAKVRRSHLVDLLPGRSNSLLNEPKHFDSGSFGFILEGSYGL